MQTDTMTLRELTIRYAPKTDVEGQPVVVGRKLTTPAECTSVLVKLLQDQPSEVFAILIQRIADLILDGRREFAKHIQTIAHPDRRL